MVGTTIKNNIKNIGILIDFNIIFNALFNNLIPLITSNVRNTYDFKQILGSV
jgi:hypothetical protein